MGKGGHSPAEALGDCIHVLGLLSCLLLFFVSPFRIFGEAEIRYDLQWVFTGDGATQVQNFHYIRPTE